MVLHLKNFISRNTGLLIRLDDVAENMNWELMERCENLFNENNIKPLLGIVPKNNDKQLLSFKKNKHFWDRVRSWKEKGWQIAMHGYSHTYDSDTYNKDYFGYGGKSEYFGHKYEDQLDKINKGLKIFDREKIKVTSFFAPNHTYDLNTFKALKKSGIENVIDGYGIMPYSYIGLNFIPQLFYKELMLPFGIQTTQIHLNTWTEKDFLNFEKFIKKNKNKIISFDQVLSKINNNYFYKILNFFSKVILKVIRFF